MKKIKYTVAVSAMAYGSLALAHPIMHNPDDLSPFARASLKLFCILFGGC